MSEDNRKYKEPKQVLVVRKDLNMSVGKYGAQVSHASLGPITNKMERTQEGNKVKYTLELDLDKEGDKAFDDWLSKRFTKVVLYVKSEEKLKNIYNKAIAKGLPAVLIQDAGFTEFDEPTYTFVGIGPALPKEFEGLTSKLRVYQGEIIPK